MGDPVDHAAAKAEVEGGRRATARPPVHVFNDEGVAEPLKRVQERNRLGRLMILRVGFLPSARAPA